MTVFKNCRGDAFFRTFFRFLPPCHMDFPPSGFHFFLSDSGRTPAVPTMGPLYPRTPFTTFCAYAFLSQSPPTHWYDLFLCLSQLQIVSCDFFFFSHSTDLFLGNQNYPPIFPSNSKLAPSSRRWVRYIKLIPFMHPPYDESRKM